MKGIAFLYLVVAAMAFGIVGSAHASSHGDAGKAAETMFGLSHQCYNSSGPPGAPVLKLNLVVIGQRKGSGDWHK